MNDDLNVEVYEELKPMLEESSDEPRENTFVGHGDTDQGAYTISDYLSPDLDDLNGATAGAAAGGGMFSYMSGGGPEEFATVAVGAALTGYLKERWDNRDLSRQAAENSFDYWSDRLEGIRK